MSPRFEAKMKLMRLEMDIEFTKTHGSLYEVCGFDPDKERERLLKELKKQQQIVNNLPPEWEYM